MGHRFEQVLDATGDLGDVEPTGASCKEVRDRDQSFLIAGVRRYQAEVTCVIKAVRIDWQQVRVLRAGHPSDDV